MKNILRRSVIVSTLILMLALPLHAQMPGGDSSPMNAAMLKMLGKNTNFTAVAEVKMADKTQGDTSVNFAIALLDGKMRAEMDMAKMKNKMLGPEMVAQMKQMGMDKNIYIVRPDKKATYLIYPGLKSYVQMPVSEADQKAMAKQPKVATTVLGKEALDGHPCVKNKVVVTDEKGETQDAIVWNATDMKDFPIQIQMKDEESTVTMKFKEVQFAKPDAKQFEPPTGFAKYDNMQQLQQAIMEKMLKQP